MRDPAEARERYPNHALIYEQKLAAAHRVLLKQHLRSATAIVDTFLVDRDVRDLQRIAMKLAMLEAGPFGYAHGANSSIAAAHYDFGALPSRYDLEDHHSRKAMLDAVPDLKTPALARDAAAHRRPTLASADRVDDHRIAGQAGIQAQPGCELYGAIGRAFPDRLCAACVVKIELCRTRIILAPMIVVGSQADAAQAPGAAE